MASPPFPSWTSVTFVAMHLDHTGCWIGFEDSAASGGFIWTDGSNTGAFSLPFHCPFTTLCLTCHCLQTSSPSHLGSPTAASTARTPSPSTCAATKASTAASGTASGTTTIAASCSTRSARPISRSPTRPTLGCGAPARPPPSPSGSASTRTTTSSSRTIGCGSSTAGTGRRPARTAPALRTTRAKLTSTTRSGTSARWAGATLVRPARSRRPSPTSVSWSRWDAPPSPPR